MNDKKIYDLNWLPNVKPELKLRFWRKKKASDGSVLLLKRYGTVFAFQWTEFGELSVIVRSPKWES